MAKGRNKRQDARNQKLFQRGASKIYYFRTRIDGKDTWMSTKTADLEEAKRTATTVLETKRATPTISRLEKSSIKTARKLSSALVHGMTGEKVNAVKISDAQAKWASQFRKHGDLKPTTRKFYESVFSCFSRWCVDKGLIYADEINDSRAAEYVKHLWDRGLTPKTFNEHLAHLSRVFQVLDRICPLPDRDPFAKDRVERVEKAEMGTASHKAMEPDQVTAVLKEAASYGQDFLDLFIIGHQTGMRLKDTALLEWKQVDGDFIVITPFKTRRTNNMARIPISQNLRKVLNSRDGLKTEKEPYVIPCIARQYGKDPGRLSIKLRNVFERAIGKEATHIVPGSHRKKLTAIYSFHSFRVTFASLLAKQGVSIRDAMRIMGWRSMEMVRLYERELEKAKENADKRALELVSRIEELSIEMPMAMDIEAKTSPTKDDLEKLVAKYSNVAIGKIYGISETAVRKWLAKFGIKRAIRLESTDLDESALAAIRAKLTDGVSHA